MTPHQYSPDEIALKLARARRLEADGVSTRQLCQVLGVAELTYLRWKRRYGALDSDAVTRLVSLEKENARLRAVIARMEDALGMRSMVARHADEVEAC
ncbi:MAG TPA: transposase [Nocardioides sp.]|nr:transposase [Nocardioides sp.]